MRSLVARKCGYRGRAGLLVSEVDGELAALADGTKRKAQGNFVGATGSPNRAGSCAHTFPEGHFSVTKRPAGLLGLGEANVGR